MVHILSAPVVPLVATLDTPWIFCSAQKILAWIRSSRACPVAGGGHPWKQETQWSSQPKINVGDT